MASLRIAHLLAPGAVGGLETVVLQLARGQQRRGHAVRAMLVVPDPQELPIAAALRAAGVTVDTMVLPGRAYLKERQLVGRLLDEHGVQVLHTHGYRPDVIDSGVARRRKLATVTTVHGFTGGSRRNRLYESLQLRVFRKFGAVVAVSRALGTLLRNRGVPEERLRVIPNGYEPREVPLSRDDARSVLRLSPSATIAGWVGRVSREKGADVFIQALPHLSRADATAVIVGDGPERRPLEARVAQLGLQARVRWMGTIPGAARLYRAFDVFVLSSRTEGTPMALLEAMAAGTPVVASAVGGVPDVLSNREGWLVPSEAPEALAAAIDAAISDPSEAGTRADHARSRLTRDLDVDRWLDRYDEVYRSLL